MNFSFDPEAEKEFEQAVDYYNECQEDLGFEFASEVYKSIDHILGFPKAWAKLSKNTRRCITDRFPYGVIYLIEDDEIIIIAIMQLQQRPNYWHNRL
jgi:toxin ParE1/3/4